MNSLLKVIQLFNNEDKLIKKALKKDRGAQHVLYNLYSAKMLSVCRYYISDLQHAEEVMLKGFFKVFSNLKSFKNEGSFEGWIRKIMVRESLSFLRKQKKIEYLIDEIETHNMAEYSIDVELEADEIQQLIDELPDGYRMVFVLYALEGYKHSEIAEILKISEGTSKSQLFKARKMLQEKLKRLNKTSYGTN